MTPEQLQQFRDLIKAGRVPDEKASENRVYLRGWNGGLEFAETHLAKVLGEKVQG
jgi:hypothetical protein